MKMNEILTAGANGFTYFLAFIQTNQAFQIAEMILAILTSIVLLAYRIWKWWQEAKKDGKITMDEIKDVSKTISDGVKEVRDTIDKRKEDKKDGEDK